MIRRYAVIPVRNQIEYTKGLVAQLLEQDEAHRIVVLDNGSTDGTASWLGKLEGVATLMADDLKSIHSLWNLGLDMIDAWEPVEPYDVAILNNDLRIGRCFLSRLSTVLRGDFRIGVAGANYDGRSFDGDAQIVRGVCGGRYDGTGGLPGFAFMLRGEEGHRFPEELHWWYGDTDLVRTIQSQGRLCVIARRANCEHLDGGGCTGDWSSPEMQPLLRSDREWFNRKWNAPLPSA